MKIENNVNLKEYNTFHLNSIANNFYHIHTTNDLNDLNKLFISDDYIVLGGGSNVLLSKEFYENVVSINLQGIEIVGEINKSVDVKVGAGVEWHYFLEYLLENNLYGLENLALIPGKCGAAPIQNIGAYGVEQEQFFVKATVYNPIDNNFFEINKEQCQFNYRYSIFKKPENKKLIITDVTYRLNKDFQPNLSYNELNKFDRIELTSKQLFNTICDIRKAKIPYPEEVGNAGSFFKNPVVNITQLEKLKELYHEIPNYQFENNYKLSAAWLIEKSGMKGKSIGKDSDAQVSDRHSLILINKGNANGAELVELSNLIIEKVKSLFDIILEREVNIL